jgi:putative oxidoreductase
MKKFFFDCGTRDSTASFGLFFLRVSVGLMMLIGHGIPRMQNFAKMKDSFPVPSFMPLNFMSPPISLVACIGGEVIASALLILGFMTRPAAFVFCFTMIVAAFDIHLGDPWFSGKTGPSKELALIYLFSILPIILAGAGSYSLDAAIYKGEKRRRW